MEGYKKDDISILRPKRYVQVEYFDQLRNKYHQVKEKVDVYSRKCFHLEERLRTLNSWCSGLYGEANLYI